MRLRPDLATLQDSPAWPVLISNLLQWQASLAPGLARPNIRLGDEAVFTFALPREPATQQVPDRVEIYPFYARRTKDGVDHDWCRQLYITGGLGKEAGAGGLFRIDLAGARGLKILPKKK